MGRRLRRWGVRVFVRRLMIAACRISVPTLLGDDVTCWLWLFGRTALRVEAVPLCSISCVRAHITAGAREVSIHQPDGSTA